jgi:hypothetical protein
MGSFGGLGMVIRKKLKRLFCLNKNDALSHYDALTHHKLKNGSTLEFLDKILNM